MTGGSPKALKNKADKKRESDHEDEFKPVAGNICLYIRRTWQE